MDQELTEKLLQAKTRLSLKEPFFSTLLFRFPLVKTDLVPLAAVTPDAQILYNPQAIEKLTVEEIEFMLCHEVLHVAFSHALRRGERDHFVFNVASDAVINEMLINLQIGCPIDGVVRFPGAENQSAEEIYDKIIKKARKVQIICDLIFSGEQNAGGTTSDSLKEATAVYGLDLGESEARRIANDVKLAVAEAVNRQKTMSKNIGTAMGQFLDWIEESILTEKLPWYELLGRFMTRFVDQGESWKRPNRRFSDVYLPSVNRESRMGTMVVGIDTSASIDQKTLACFGQHLFDVIEECKPVQVIVLWCDAKVAKVESHEYDDVPFELEVVGRGGTDMREVTHWVNENEPEADACVILTDGLTPYPDEGEEKVPTLWVIAKSSILAPKYLNTVVFEMDGK
ncbi:MAG TPA: hypothetical protein IAC65_01405 [Candidatus Aphodousia faecipullorum]|nr:hypothetical protein [Candidatus Aphodousia faecipullorum]